MKRQDFHLIVPIPSHVGGPLSLEYLRKDKLIPSFCTYICEWPFFLSHSFVCITTNTLFEEHLHGGMSFLKSACRNSSGIVVLSGLQTRTCPRLS